MRCTSVFVLFSACALPDASRVAPPVASPASAPAAHAPAYDVDDAMTRGWALLASRPKDEGLDQLRRAVAAGDLPRAPICGRDDSRVERSRDGRVSWITTPRGFFFFTTQPSPSPMTYAPVHGRVTVLSQPRWLVSETQGPGATPQVRVLDLSGSTRFHVPDASLLAASDVGRRILIERWPPHRDEPHPVEVWDTAKGQHVRTLSLRPGDELAVGAPTLSPDERSVVLSLSRTRVPEVFALFELATGAERGAWPHGLGAPAPDFSPDGRLLVVVDDATRASSLVDVRTGGTIARSLACPDPIQAVFSRRGDVIAVSARTGACLLEVPTLRLRWRAGLQSEREWASIDYHDDLFIGGFVGDDAAVVVTSAQGACVALDVASGHKVLDGCGLYASELGPADPRALCGLAETAACRVGDWIVPADACP